MGGGQGRVEAAEQAGRAVTAAHGHHRRDVVAREGLGQLRRALVVGSGEVAGGAAGAAASTTRPQDSSTATPPPARSAS